MARSRANKQQRELLALPLVQIGLLLLLFMANSPSTARAASLQQRLESASVVQEFDTEGARIQRVSVAQDMVGFQLLKKDSTVIVVYDANGAARFRYGVANVAGDQMLSGLNLSEDGSTVVVAEGLDDGSVKQVVFSIDGKRRFDSKVRAELLPSLDGQYFCTLHNHEFDPLFEIFGPQGELIRRFSSFPHREWTCGFLSAECLLVIYSDTVFFVSPSTGEIQNVKTLGFGGRPMYRSLRFSSSDSLIAVYDQNQLLLMNPDGGELWRSSFSDFLRAVAFDGDERIVLQFQVPQQRAGYFKVLSGRDFNESSQSLKIENLPVISDRSCDRLWVSGGLVTAVMSNTGLRHIDSEAEMATVFLQCDLKSGSIGPPSRARGFFHALRGQDNARQFLWVTAPTGASLVSIEMEGE